MFLVFPISIKNDPSAAGRSARTGDRGFRPAEEVCRHGLPSQVPQLYSLDELAKTHML